MKFESEVEASRCYTVLIIKKRAFEESFFNEVSASCLDYFCGERYLQLFFGNSRWRVLVVVS